VHAGTRVRLPVRGPAGGAASFELAAWQSPPAGWGRPGIGFLFLHAIGLCHRSWEAAARRVGEHYAAVALTLAGFGESDLAPGDDYSLQAHAGHVLGALAALGEQGGAPDRWVLVGNSLGGAVALAAAPAAADRIAGMVLVNAAAYPGALPWIGRPGCVPGAQRLLALTPAWCLRLGLVVGSGRRGWTTPAHGQRCRAAFRRPGGSRAFTLTLRSLYGAELALQAAHYPRIGCPCLVLRGERDPLIRPAVSERLARDLPDARLLSLPRRGHFPQEEDPAQIADLCLGFGRTVFK
jgi:pimeloyl-ACP methyl ester carboxylesterase